MAIIWIDIKNSHEPAFFEPFLKKFKQHRFIVTSRKYAEIQKLLEQSGIENKVIGKHYGGNTMMKMAGLAIRDLLLTLKVPHFDISLSHGSINAIHAAKLRSKFAISFTDNDKSSIGNKISFKFIDYIITPNAISSDTLIGQGAKKGHIIQYDGYKEDIYEADFKPDPNFLNLLPFEEFITIRPEALHAAYVKRRESIVPDLLKSFNKENIRIVYLPRYPTDRDYARGKEAFIPKNPLRGLDVCYYSKAVLTGSGTFAREAACMGTPAVSFYPEELLAVDQRMVDEGRIFHSREPEEIVDYVLNAKKRRADLTRSKRVQSEVFKIFGDILDEIESKKEAR